MAIPTNPIRGNPYFGTYSGKPVLVQAPDAMVFVNEEHIIPICLECDTKVSLKSFITNLNCSLSIDGSGGGTASFDLVVPRHSNVSFVRDGKLLLANMMEVEIYYKGAFTINGMPRYYRAFWGYISGITDSYSDGNHSISVSCKDMLSFWNVIKLNIHPSLISDTITGRRNVSVFSSVFENGTPFSILTYLTLVTSTDLAVASSLQNDTVASEEAKDAFRQSSDQLIQYWARRMNKISKAIRIYGVQGDNIFDAAQFLYADKATQKKIFRSLKSVTTQRIVGVSLAGADSPALFNPYNEFKNITLFENDSQGRLDVMVRVKDHIGWEFYLDMNGEIVFKPPYYNVDVRQNYPVSWIRDIDVIDWSFSENEPEATRVTTKGSWKASPFVIPIPDEVAPEGVFQDMNLARQYGVRHEDVTTLWLGSSKACGYYAADRMGRHAANRFEGSVTIPGRPELRLGLPIYIESRDCFYYITGISHSFAFGSTFTTTLSLRGRRARYSSTEFVGRTSDLADLRVDGNGVNRDQDGRNVGIPNVIMRPATHAETDALGESPLTQGTTKKDGSSRTLSGRSGSFLDHTDDAEERIRQRDDEQRGISWYFAGSYFVYDLDPNAGTNQAITAVHWSPSDGPPGTEKTMEDEAIPVSDAAGYEVIGVFPYGRGLIINSDGGLASSSGELDSNNQPVPSELSVLSNVEAAKSLRDATPDDLVEATENVSSRSSIGGGILSTASVLKVDQTNDGLLFAEMAPDSDGTRTCTCVDNYTIDNLLLLQSVDGVFTDVFEAVANVEDLMTNSYQVDSTEVMDYEASKQSTQTGSSLSFLGSGGTFGNSQAPWSPSVPETTRSSVTNASVKTTGSLTTTTGTRK